MEIKRLEGAVEAILFAMGESVELGQIHWKMLHLPHLRFHVRLHFPVLYSGK